MPERHDAVDLERLAALIDRWAARARDDLNAASPARPGRSSPGADESSPRLEAVEREPSGRRWLIRLKGEDKEHITIWLTLAERTLHHECHVLPAPEEGHRAVYEHLLRANQHLYGMAFAIGPEDAVYLRGQVPLDWLDEDELDRVLGSSWLWTERHFRTLLRLGFAARMKTIEQH